MLRVLELKLRRPPFHQKTSAQKPARATCVAQLLAYITGTDKTDTPVGECIETRSVW